MKLVKLKCGTWINPEMVTGIEPFHEQDGPVGATLYHLARLDAVQTEETADELAAMFLEAVEDPLVISDDGEILQPSPEPDATTVTVGPGPGCDFETFADMVDAFPTHDNRDGTWTVELKPKKKEEKK